VDEAFDVAFRHAEGIGSFSSGEQQPGVIPHPYPSTT